MDMRAGEEITCFYGLHYLEWGNAECMCAACEERGDGVFRLLTPTRHGPDGQHPDTSVDLTMEADDDVTSAAAKMRRASARIAKKPPPSLLSTGRTKSAHRPDPSLPRSTNAPDTDRASAGTQHGVEAQLQPESTAGVAMDVGSDAPGPAPSANSRETVAGANMGPRQPRNSARIASSKSSSLPSTPSGGWPELAVAQDSGAPALAMEGDSDAPASAPSADSSATAARLGLRLLQPGSSTRLANKSKSRSSLSSQVIALRELAVEVGSNAPEVATEEDNDAPSSSPGPNPSVTIGDEDDLASATGTSMGLMQPRTSVRLAYKAKSKAEAATSTQQVKKSKSSLSEGVAKAHRQPAASTPRRSQFLFGGTNYYATGSLCPPLGCFQGARRWPEFAEDPTSPPSRSSTPPLSPIKRAKKQLPTPESEPADSSWVLADALVHAEEEIADALRAWRKAAQDKGIEFDGLEAVRRTIPRRGGDEGEFWQAGDVAGGMKIDDASDCAVVEDAFTREAAYVKRVGEMQGSRPTGMRLRFVSTRRRAPS
ncbi:histone lysine methyltransferase Set9 [Tilletia horrida]|nr:histone lysine methyltransferase Set9 [Tilletia horrida]